MELTVTQAEKPKTLPDESSLGFGQLFTDHMFQMDYSPEKGWHNHRIEPYGPIAMEPSTMVLHYGQGVFEGLKAYKTPSGNIQLFRPRDNFRRMNDSNRRMCIPEIEIDDVMTALNQLLIMEKRWVPGAPGTSLYIRPTVVAMDPFLGVRASFSYRFFIILSPVGAYYAEGFNPIKIWVSEKYVRAVKGGVGEKKTIGNYAASLYAGELAYKEGYAQVLWLDGVERKWVEEVGSMNIFFVIDDEIITPALSGSILPGITRNSVIQLAKHWKMTVSEKRISIDEILSAHADGRLTEVFGSGTAAVISPVGELKYGGTIIHIGDGEVGPVANKLYKTLTDIQFGLADDPLSWIVPVT